MIVVIVAPLVPGSSDSAIVWPPYPTKPLPRLRVSVTVNVCAPSLSPFSVRGEAHSPTPPPSGLPSSVQRNVLPGSLEAELRYDLTRRWTVVGFGGLGVTGGEFSDLLDADAHWAGGAGFRYLVAANMT